MKMITNTFIFDTSNDDATDLIAGLKQHIPSENFINQKNQICLNVENTPLFATLTETTVDHETTLIYALYYQKELLATTEKRRSSSSETSRTLINKQNPLPSTVLSSTPIPVMKPEDYDILLQAYDETLNKKQHDILQIEIVQSFISPTNIIALNEQAHTILKRCYSALAKKNKQTSFAGFLTQFKQSEMGFIKQSECILEFFPWFTAENKNLAKALGLEFLRTIINGYDFLPSQALNDFFTEPAERKAYIDNFISYARLTFENRDTSGDSRETQQRCFNQLVDVAILNGFSKEADDTQRKHFLETIYSICRYYKLSTKTLMLFNPNNIIDRSIFNEILELNIGAENEIPEFGLFSNAKSFTKSELIHLRKLLSHDKIQLFNQWGILDKPEMSENNLPDFLFSEKLVTKVNLKTYLPTRTDINWEEWLKKIFAPYADIRLFMKEFAWNDLVNFVVVLEHNKSLPRYYASQSIAFNMDTGSLILSHPQIRFSVRGPNRNGSQSGYYLSTEYSVLEFQITDIDCLEKDFDKLWQALSLDLTQIITRIFEKGIDYNPNKTRCVSWKNDKLDLVKQMQSLAKGDCIDCTLDKKYFQETNLDELASIEEPITIEKPAHSDELIPVDTSVPNLYGLFASSSVVESKASEKSCSGCNLI